MYQQVHLVHLANKQSCLKDNIADFVQLLLWADLRAQTALSSCYLGLLIQIGSIHLLHFWCSEAPGFPQHFWHARHRLLRTTSTGTGKSKIRIKAKVLGVVHTGQVSPRVISAEPAQHSARAYCYLFPHWLETPVSFSTVGALPARLCKLNTDSMTCAETKGKKHLPAPLCAARDAAYGLTQAFAKHHKPKEKKQITIRSEAVFTHQEWAKQGLELEMWWHPKWNNQTPVRPIMPKRANKQATEILGQDFFFWREQLFKVLSFEQKCLRTGQRMRFWF